MLGSRNILSTRSLYSGYTLSSDIVKLVGTGGFRARHDGGYLKLPPSILEKNYDLSAYITNGQGNVDSDVNIAKLALALEIGAAVGYVSDTTKLKSPYMIELEAGIACIEAIHAARIRASFNALGIKIPVVPGALISAGDRDNWVMKVDRAA